jgi:ABC-type transport system involved in multi-copper enzyme maturation permease subunit
MPLSTFIFYCGNITLLTAYAILARMSARPGGVTGVSMPGPLLKWSGVAFFSLAALLHLDMAIHTITRIPFFDNGTSRITWDFSIIVFAKMTSVVVALIGVRSDAHRRRTVSPG